MSDLKLNRPIERWKLCVPKHMALQSKAALEYAFADMRHDILVLSRELERLQAENENQHDLIMRQCDILTNTANALKGEPDGLSLHSHHDLAAVASKLKAENGRLKSAIEHVCGYWNDGAAPTSARDAIYHIYAVLNETINKEETKESGSD